MDNLLGKKELKSKKLLTEAFFELLEENPGENITVKDICDKAGYARPTFYVNFNKIRDLVYDHYEKVYLVRISEYCQGVDNDPNLIEEYLKDTMVIFYDYWYFQISRYRLLRSIDLDIVVLMILEESIKIFVKKFYPNHERIFMSLEGECSMKTGAQITKTIYDYWIKNGRTWDSEKMALITKSFIDSVLLEFNKLNN